MIKNINKVKEKKRLAVEIAQGQLHSYSGHNKGQKNKIKREIPRALMGLVGVANGFAIYFVNCSV